MRRPWAKQAGAHVGLVVDTGQRARWVVQAESQWPAGSRRASRVRRRCGRLLEFVPGEDHRLVGRLLDVMLELERLGVMAPGTRPPPRRASTAARSPAGSPRTGSAAASCPLPAASKRRSAPPAPTTCCTSRPFSRHRPLRRAAVDRRECLVGRSGEHLQQHLGQVHAGAASRSPRPAGPAARPVQAPAPARRSAVAHRCRRRSASGSRPRPPGMFRPAAPRCRLSPNIPRNPREASPVGLACSHAAPARSFARRAPHLEGRDGGGWCAWSTPTGRCVKARKFSVLGSPHAITRGRSYA